MMFGKVSFMLPGDLDKAIVSVLFPKKNDRLIRQKAEACLASQNTISSAKHRYYEGANMTQSKAQPENPELETANFLGALRQKGSSPVI